jgi:hypothetical protein
MVGSKKMDGRNPGVATGMSAPHRPAYEMAREEKRSALPAAPLQGGLVSREPWNIP